MKVLKTITAILSTVAISVSFFSNDIEANASQNSPAQAFNEYVESCIPQYIAAQNLETQAIVQYSNPIALYDFESGNLTGSEIFVIDDNELIGKIDLLLAADGYISAFDTGITEALSTAYRESTEIALGYYEDSLWLYTESDGFVYIDGIQNCAPENVPSQLNKITVSGSVQIPLLKTSRALGGLSLKVSHVSNSINYDSNGQCSEACVAMVLNYHNGTYMTADSVWTSINDNNKSGVPYKALQELGYNPVYASTALSADSVYKTLKDDKPIIASIKNSDGKSRHAVVICGVTIDASQSTYTIDDPNYSTKQSFIVSANPVTVNSTITYAKAPKYITWYNYAY